ncbi:MAG TPA: nitroreductase family protein [Pirellulales bacterium]|jgi:nitroreductase
MTERAVTDYPILDVIADRWSPYAFADRDVSSDDLHSLFEAARWAPSSFNEQPWSYIVATRDQADEFARLLSCLVDVNQAWAKFAPVLAIGCTKLNFTHSGQPNSCAQHDLGLASGSLVLEATARGLAVHQMAGILPERAHELFEIPDGVRALTGLAIGYHGAAERLPEKVRDRDKARRPRKPQSEFVFTGKWGTST